MLIPSSGTPAFSQNSSMGPWAISALCARAAVQKTKPIPCISMQNGGCSVSHSGRHCRSALGQRWEIPDLLVSARKCTIWLGGDRSSAPEFPAVSAAFQLKESRDQALRQCVVDRGARNKPSSIPELTSYPEMSDVRAVDS